MIVNVVEQQEPCRNVEQSKAHDDKPHDRPATERNDKPAVQARNRPVRRPGTRIRCRLHSEEAAQTAKEASRQKSNRHKRILYSENRKRHEDEEEDDKHHGYRPVLPLEIGVRPDTNIMGNRFHFTIAVRSSFHKTVKEQCHAQSNQRCNRDKVPIRRNRKHRNLAYWVLSP